MWHHQVSSCIFCFSRADQQSSGKGRCSFLSPYIPCRTFLERRAKRLSARAVCFVRHAANRQCMARSRTLYSLSYRLPAVFFLLRLDQPSQGWQADSQPGSQSVSQTVSQSVSQPGSQWSRGDAMPAHFASSPACLPACLSACQPACLPACLPACVVESG